MIESGEKEEDDCCGLNVFSANSYIEIQSTMLWYKESETLQGD
jgi:hypothetical protein